MFDVTFVLKVLGLKTATQNPWKTFPRYTGLPKKIARDGSTSVTEHLAFSGLTPLPSLFHFEKTKSFVFEL